MAAGGEILVIADNNANGLGVFLLIALVTYIIVNIVIIIIDRSRMKRLEKIKELIEKGCQ